MKPLVDKTLLLEKFDGKGGWTYGRIPGLTKDKNVPARGVRVMGTIDGYAINRYHLMPMGDGHLMLAVKAEIRKQIGKQAGDKIRVILYPDTTALEIPGELQMCLEDEPSALHFFNKLSDSDRKYYVQWIYSAKKEETKANRIAKAIDKLSRGLKMYDIE